MERNWLNIGREARACDPVITDDEIVACIEGMEWHAVPHTVPLPAVPAFAINAYIRDARMPKITAAAWNGTVGPYGLYGVEAFYLIGRVRVYLLDRGSDVVAVLTDFWTGATKENPNP